MPPINIYANILMGEAPLMMECTTQCIDYISIGTYTRAVCFLRKPKYWLWVSNAFFPMKYPDIARKMGTAQFKNCRINRLVCRGLSEKQCMPMTKIIAIPRRKSKYVSRFIMCEIAGKKLMGRGVWLCEA